MTAGRDRLHRTMPIFDVGHPDRITHLQVAGQLASDQTYVTIPSRTWWFLMCGHRGGPRAARKAANRRRRRAARDRRGF